MATFIIVLIATCVIGLFVWANYSANYALTVESPLTPESSAAEVRKCFIASANRIATTGDGLEITPKLKKDAPSLVIDISQGPTGSRLSMYGKYTAERRGFLPWVPMHGTWIWRKQRKIARRVARRTGQTVGA